MTQNSIGHSKSGPKREIRSNTGLCQEKKKNSNKLSNFILKETRKRTAY